jgi:tRNA(adenine34) deaminase
MCAGALYWSQIDKVVFGARDENRGASQHERSLYHPTTLVSNGILQEECSQLLKEFFSAKRK